MTKKSGILTVYFLGVFIVGCSTKPTIQIHEPLVKSKNPKQVVLFLDGTQNNRDSRTNISTLSEIIKHQDKDNLYMFYNEGVGTDEKVIGAGTGLGIGKDVVEAYAFLTKYYSSKSKLYVFGFSRGAYTSRILAGMIYSVGIYNLNTVGLDDRMDIAEELYSVYKGKNKIVGSIRNDANDIIIEWKGKLPKSKSIETYKPDYQVMIDVMGLWDTVEALGIIPTLEAIQNKVFGIKDPQNIVNPNGRYIDQICNAKNVYHALSLDDNRANVFTPIIISSKHVTSKCSHKDESITPLVVNVDEVWFSGAHSDIGGGYTKDEYNKKDNATDKDVSISGVSLNWMMSKIKLVAPDLLPEQARVFESPFGYVHDAQNYDIKYARESRNKILLKYKDFSKYRKLRIHNSVFKRIAKTKDEKKNMGYDSGWYTMKEFKDCFNSPSNGPYKFKKCSLIEQIN